MTKSRDNKPPDAGSVLRRMERLMGGAAKGKEQEAQDLVYDAWEAVDGDQAFDLLTQAVELDPTNVDAWLGLMVFEPLDSEERIEFLRRIVAMGEKNLGKKTFLEGKGHFWGLLETRPYMRARSQLAQRLMDAGRLEEAMAEHEGMLELNPGDNQGVRYILLSLYLALNRLDGAARLFQEYDEREYSTVFAWGYVLERFLAGDAAGATEALQDARKQNPHTQAYFLGHRRLPKHMPGAYRPGSKEEAIMAWDILEHAWNRHPKAQAWLRVQCGK